MRRVLLPLLLLVACVDADRVEQRDAFLFCGDAPCGWTLAAGQVEPGPTWHTRATGISFVTPGSRIQTTADNSGCLTLAYAADLQTSVRLEIDTNGDGAPELSEPLRGRAFEAQERHYRIPEAAESVHLSLEKTGTGRAVLGSFETATAHLGCPADAPQLPVNAQLGDPCEGGATCVAGTCVMTTFTVRAALSFPIAEPVEIGHCSTCAEAENCAFGERCEAHGQCTSGVCLAGFCGCSGDADCEAGTTCHAGQCDACTADDDCTAGQRCAYPPTLAPAPRTCRLAADLPTGRKPGLLCDIDEQCAEGTCDAAGGLPTRCGSACRTAEDCAEGELCFVDFWLDAQIPGPDGGLPWFAELVDGDPFDEDDIIRSLNWDEPARVLQPSVCWPQPPAPTRARD